MFSLSALSLSAIYYTLAWRGYVTAEGYNGIVGNSVSFAENQQSDLYIPGGCRLVVGRQIQTDYLHRGEFVGQFDSCTGDWTEWRYHLYVGMYTVYQYSVGFCNSVQTLFQEITDGVFWQSILLFRYYMHCLRRNILDLRMHSQSKPIELSLENGYLRHCPQYYLSAFLS